MGEAKRRGTFEERKAQAIKAGRVKRPTMPMAELEARLMNDLMGRYGRHYPSVAESGQMRYMLNPYNTGGM